MAMKPGLAAPVLAAIALLAGCGADPASEPAPSPLASPGGEGGTATVPTPEAAASVVPVLNAKGYPPRDDCSALPGWTEFRAKLQTAVKQRDADALAALSDPGIELDYGGGAGVRELRRRLDDQEYKLWDEIDALLPLGCGFKEGNAFLPWVFWNDPDNADPYTAMLVLGSAVPARTKPEASAPVIGTLDWAFVDFADDADPAANFTRVKLPGGAIGYVESRKLRSLIDYRLIAERGKQGWRITALIAGD
ncbi:hypothetical protein [Erythrobacter sp. CCH5-A1]|uniref:hypothetical protein n=1 Tax=Erythrobacter sp. CCH5-A1 TaxID=1768792 RepID=UPI000836207D|nr:hypothetical protein [Erythrobacter sp. CCH5-A1]